MVFSVSESKRGGRSGESFRLGGGCFMLFLAGVDAACRQRFVGLESNRRRRGSGILSILHAFLHGFYFYLLSFIPRVHTKQSTKSPNLLLESQKDDFGCHRERQLYELLCCVRILHGCLICDPENYTRLV